MTDNKYPLEVADGVFVVWKRQGQTPLQALEQLRAEQGIDMGVPMTYAGRLDPLAEGELLILLGEMCKSKEQYLSLDKVYEVEILFGAQTDTGDVMGVVDSTSLIQTAKQGFAVSSQDVVDVLHEFVGVVRWEYPAFSSKTVNGKPLFLWALENRIDEIEMPIRESEIYELELLESELGSRTTKLLRDVVCGKIMSIPKVKENIINSRDTKALGRDFRRDEVIKSWETFFNKVVSDSGAEEMEFTVVRLRARVSSGTYMRTLARKLGERLNTQALALSIVRTEIVL